MKKIVAIVLLCAHLFSLGLYTLVFDYFIQKSDVELVKQMYDTKPGSPKMIVLKIPVHMPTIQDWTEYAHVVGQIQLNDGYYNYVGIKMTRDTMSLICLPNHVKDKLVKANLIMAKQLNDVPLNKKSPLTLTKKARDGYDDQHQTIRYSGRQLTDTRPAYRFFIKASVDHPYIESPGKPPDFSCNLI